MSEYTKNLNLFKYNTVEDADKAFSINEALNNNWDKLDTQCLKKSGDTMTGNLLMNKNAGNIEIKGKDFQSFLGTSTEIDATNTSQVSLNGLRLMSKDKNNQYFGVCQFRVLSNSSYQTDIITRRSINNAWVSASIVCGIDKTGIQYTRAFTPTNVADNSTNIATTAWVRKVLSTTGGAFGTWSKAKNGYIKLTNGIIIQWGTTAAFTGNNQTKTITLPSAFTNSTYIITTGIFGKTDSDDNIFTTAKTTTNFTLWSTTVGHNDGTWSLVVDWMAIGY